MLVPGTRHLWRKGLELWLARQMASGRLTIRRF
jgi:hypothetical protein